MALIDRVRNICVSPATEWPIIEQERTDSATLITGYLLPLAAIGAVAGFLGQSFVGTTIPFVGTYRTPIVSGLVAACVGVIATIIGCFVVAFIINALAPTFGARQDSNQALKTSVYSYTPGLVAAVVTILPVLGSLVTIVAGLYGLYLLYVGLPVTMKAPRDKTVAYTVVIVICAIILAFIISLIVGAIAGVGMMGAGAL
jgi:membrane protein YqaA with SNARE-associated domain